MATRKRDRFFALFFAILFLGTSCALAITVIVSNLQRKDDTATSQTTGTKLAGTPLENFTPIASVPTLQSTDTKVGTGAVVEKSSTIDMDYTGALASTGIIFESSLDTGESVTRPLTDFITGWQEGLPGMKAGGTRRLIIPAAQAYGSGASEKVPANSDLVFDITVHAVTK